MAHDILVVDDEADIRNLVSGILSDEGYETRAAADSASALVEIKARLPSLLILDIWLQGSDLDGLQVLDQVMVDYSDLPVVVMSGHGNIETAVSAIKRGAYDFIEKPFKTNRLLVIVERAIEAERLRRENRELKLHAGRDAELIGTSSSMNGLRQTIEKVANTDSRVLISGPAGSGKEVVARLVHAHSSRADRPLMVVNAASMAPERMEMELFGVEEGAPNWDNGRRAGILEQAHGGTLFIDEVADMPLETQAKILRVLQDQKFERVGGSNRVHVDVRVVSATNRDLQEEIITGRFREDFYHRLNVVPVRVPALKERPGDIPHLCHHFMVRTAVLSGLPGREISEEAMAVLQSCDWPGNVRELRNLIERLLIMAPGDGRSPITVDMLPAELGAKNLGALRPNGSEKIMGMSLRDAREIFEREYLVAQINRFGGNVSRTAQFVGMERSALHRKLKSLGVDSNGRDLRGRP